MKLPQNEMLIGVKRNLSLRPPNWDEVRKKFKDFNSQTDEMKYNWGMFSGIVGELCVRTALEEIRDQCEPDMIDLDPVTEKSFGQYRFFRNHRGLHIYEGDNIRTEYDEIVVIDSLPVVVDLTLRKNYLTGSSSRRNPSARRMSFKLGEERVNFKLDPVREYFNSNCGYMLITHPNYVRNNSSCRAAFRKSGGVVVPFYAGPTQYKLDLQNFAFEMNLDVLSQN